MTAKRIISLLQQKCPHCYSQHIFENINMYRLKTLTKMRERCPQCGESFRREPGFYFGAAYVSYGLMVAIDLIIAAIIYLFTGSLFNNVTLLISIIAIANIFLTPPVFRYSRIIFLYFFVKPKEH